MTDTKKPAISIAPDGPYIVQGLQDFRGADGALPAQEKMALCRCGGSKNKPFCDGSHASNGFSGENTADADKDKRDTYVGAAIAVHDNRSVCAHAGKCTDGLASVFRLRKEPWIVPDAASAEEVIATIEQCPSGALSYTVGGIERREREGAASILVAKGGPYVVFGVPDLGDIARADSVAKGHYTLCRCGGSKNKPFCDGTHWTVKFDEANQGDS